MLACLLLVTARIAGSSAVVSAKHELAAAQAELEAALEKAKAVQANPETIAHGREVLSQLGETAHDPQSFGRSAAQLERRLQYANRMHREAAARASEQLERARARKKRAQPAELLNELLEHNRMQHAGRARESVAVGALGEIHHMEVPKTAAELQAQAKRQDAAAAAQEKELEAGDADLEREIGRLAAPNPDALQKVFAPLDSEEAELATGAHEAEAGRKALIKNQKKYGVVMGDAEQDKDAMDDILQQAAVLKSKPETLPAYDPRKAPSENAPDLFDKDFDAGQAALRAESKAADKEDEDEDDDEASDGLNHGTPVDGSVIVPDATGEVPEITEDEAENEVDATADNIDNSLLEKLTHMREQMK